MKNLALVLACLSVPAVLNAGPIVNDWIVLTDGPGGGNGGSFWVSAAPGTPTFTPFLTFCLEDNEYFNPGKPYRVSGLDTFAWKGGSGDGDPLPGDSLDPRTAYLYTMFMNGTLKGFTGSETDYTNLQRAIWYIENERSGVNNAFVALANAAVAPGGEWYGKGIGNVRVMNIDSGIGTTPGQSQLIMIPEPGTILLLGTALLGLGLRRRKKPL